MEEIGRKRQSRRDVSACVFCERPVHSFFSGQPLCSTHYRSEREKYKTKIITDLIININQTLEKQPALRTSIDLNLLQKAMQLFRSLKEKKTSQVQDKRPTKKSSEIEGLRVEIEELKQLIHSMAKPSKKKSKI